MKKLILVFIFIPNILFAGSMKAIGVKGSEESVDRVIKVSMYDNYYKPNKFEIKKNETIKFIVKNKDTIDEMDIKEILDKGLGDLMDKTEKRIAHNKNNFEDIVSYMNNITK